MHRVVLIKTCKAFRERAAACDSTWAKALRAADVPVYFAEGGNNPGAVSAIGDLGGTLKLLAPDGYKSLSFKLREAIDRILLLEKGFDCLFVADDDTFVHHEKWLAHEPEVGLECRLFRPVSEFHVKLNGGWPWVDGGSGWYMSRELCEYYLRACKRHTSQDDVLVARYARTLGIKAIDRPDLYGDKSPMIETQMTQHGVTPFMMVKLFNSLMREVV